VVWQLSGKSIVWQAIDWFFSKIKISVGYEVLRRPKLAGKRVEGKIHVAHVSEVPPVVIRVMRVSVFELAIISYWDKFITE